MSGWMNTAVGHRRRASAEDIAEWTPHRRASYEAADTTPRPPVPPTTTGRPRSSGRRSSSTETKNASMSTCRIERTTVANASGTRAYDDPVDSPDALSALPSRGARVLAFVSICLAGAAGALVGFALVDVQCEGECAVPEGIGILTGGTAAAIGTASGTPSGPTRFVL